MKINKRMIRTYLIFTYAVYLLVEMVFCFGIYYFCSNQKYIVTCILFIVLTLVCYLDKGVVGDAKFASTLATEDASRIIIEGRGSEYHHNKTGTIISSFILSHPLITGLIFGLLSR